VHDIVKLLLQSEKRAVISHTEARRDSLMIFLNSVFSPIMFSRLLINPIAPSRIFRKFATKADQVQCQDLSRSPGINEKKILT
jgi:hypothetical protein